MYFFCFSFELLIDNAQWTKTGTQPALTARVEPSSDVENVGATFETVARFSVKPPNQSIADTELNDASGGTTAQKMGVAVTKNNANGMVLDNVPPTNDDKLDHLASGIAYQEHREECSLGKTGTTMCC
jgi:hypothetical protein